MDEPSIPSICEADRTGVLAVSDDERVSELCGSMAVAVPAFQSGRDCGRVAVAEPAPQRRRLKLLGGSQDTTVGMPSNVSPVLSCLGLRSCTPPATLPRAGSSVPPPVIAAVDISTPRDVREGLINSSECESADLSIPVGEDDRDGLLRGRG